jgi:ParB-like chromosome segregation protein Spo0J
VSNSTSLFQKRQPTLGLVAINQIAPWQSGARSASTRAIKTLGFASPVLLRAFPEPRQITYEDGSVGTFLFEVVDGARRLDDAKREGMEQIPATVLPPETTEAEVAAHRITANLSRRPNPAHEVEALQSLFQTYQQQGLSTEEAPRAIAAALGISLGTVKRRLKLTTLPPVLRQAVAEGKVAASVAEGVAGLNPEQQQALVEHLNTTGKLNAADVADARRVRRESQLAGLGEILLALDAQPEPVELFRQAVRQALSAGLTYNELLAALEEAAPQMGKEVGSVYCSS